MYQVMAAGITKELLRSVRPPGGPAAFVTHRHRKMLEFGDPRSSVTITCQACLCCRRRSAADIRSASLSPTLAPSHSAWFPDRLRRRFKLFRQLLR
jgi:hypothetical protein